MSLSRQQRRYQERKGPPKTSVTIPKVDGAMLEIVRQEYKKQLKRDISDAEIRQILASKKGQDMIANQLKSIS